MKKLVMVFLLASIVSIGTGSFFCAEAAEKGPITLSVINVVDALNPVNAAITMWKGRIEGATDGRVKLDIRGGPETIPVLEQIEAVKNKIVDVNCTFAAYYASLAPEVLTLHLSQLEPWEERKSGYFDYIDKAHNRIGIKYMGRWQIHMPLYIWLTKPVEKLEDFVGLKLRTMALYDRFFRKLGVVPVSMPHSDIYTALQRNLIVGMGYPFIGGRAAGYPEMTKYIVDIPYFDASNSVMLVNLDAWKKIPKDLQDKMTDATAQYERDVADMYDKMRAEERIELAKQGVKFIGLSPEERKKYREMAYDVEWEALKEKLSPGEVEKVKKLAGY